MRRNLIVLCFCLMAGLTRSQDIRLVDSLQTVACSSTGERKYSALHELAASYFDADNEKALQVVKEAELVANAIKDSLLIVKSRRLKGQILFRLGQPQAVIELLDPLLLGGHLRHSEQELMSILNLMGISHLFIGQFDKSLDYHFRTLRMAKFLADSGYMAMSLGNIAISYYKLKSYRKALPYLIESYELEKLTNDKDFSTPMNISLCYSNLRDFERARAYLEESLELCSGRCRTSANLHIKYASGLISYGLEDYINAQAEFVESLGLCRQIKDHRMQLDNIYMLAKINLKLGRIENAKRFLAEGERVVRSGLPFNMEVMKVYQQLAELYLLASDYERATFYQASYSHLRDSIYNETLMTSLMKVESEHLQEENRARILAQNEMISSNEQVIFRQTIVIALIGLLAVSLSALLAILFRHYRFKKSVNLLLEEKIRSRTVELEDRVKLYIRMSQESRARLHKVVDTITETAITLEGLCTVGFAASFDMADQTFSNLRKVINRLNDAKRRALKK